MSENPYQSPIPVAQTGVNHSGDIRPPSGLKTICIICIVLGSLGLLGSLMGLVGLLFQQQFTEFQQSVSDPVQHAMQEKMLEAQSSYYIPNVIMTLCNLVIAPLLLVGGIGVLSKKGWGQKILSRALISAAIFVLIRTVLTSFLQFKVFALMKETMTAQIPAGQQSGTMETIMTASLFFGFAVGLAFALAFAAFYYWSWRYLKKDHCQGYLSTFTS